MARSLEPWAEGLTRRLDDAEDDHETAPPSVATPRRHRGTVGRRSSRRRRIPAAAAAALALAAASAYLLVPVDPVADPPADVRRGASVSGLSPADDAVVDRVPEGFAWPAQLGATGYRIRLFDARAELVWQSGPLDSSEASLPPEVLRLFESPGSYSWTVEVEGSVRKSRLGPFSFHVGQE